MKRFLSLACLACFLFPLIAQADDMADDFEWFGKLGFPDVKGLQFVKFIVAWSGDGKKMKPVWSNGFLLEETPEKFRVLTLNFQTTEIPKKAAKEYQTQTGTKSLVEPQDFKAYVESKLNPDPTKPAYARQMGLGDVMGLPIFREERSAAFVLAWDCSRLGLDDEAAKLYAAAQQKSSVYSGDKDVSFRTKITNDVSTVVAWGILLDFDKLEITRPQLLEKLEHFQATFPGTSFFPKAREMADELKIMVAEDAAHPKLTAEEIAKLPPAGQAKEWIFRLRDQNGKQMSQPGGPWIFFNDEKPGDKSPAEHLVDLGDAAVPALLDALDDQRLTRTIGCGRDFYFSHYVMTVGAAVYQIFGRMGNRGFEKRADVEAWWRTRQQKGEAGELIEAVSRGDHNAASAGFLLVTKYPDQAGDAILAGVKAATNPYIRGELMVLAEKLKKNPVPDSVLLEKATDGPLPSRIEAAYDLARRGRSDTIPALAKEWETIKLQPSQGGRLDDEETREKLIHILAVADSPIGVDALRDGLIKTDRITRRTAIMSFDIGGLSRIDFGSGPLKINRSPETLSAIEALLAGELEDTSDQTGRFSGEEQGIKLPSELRLCDLAAFQLSRRWPDRYKFNTTGTLEEREKDRLACLEAWRASQQKKSQ